MIRGFCILLMPERKVLHIQTVSKRNSEFLAHLRTDFGERIRLDEPLAKHCTLRIGGPARIWAEPETEEEVSQLLDACSRTGTDHFVVGLGSNTLFPDEGIDGVVIRLGGALATFEVEGDLAQVGGGAVNAHMVRGLLKDGWVGMEFLALVPGTMGGAVAMNAGTKERELSEILVGVRVIDPTQPWTTRIMTAAELQLSYRHAQLPAGAIVVGATINVTKGDVESAKIRVAEDKARRNKTQPYKLASVGSTFANPEGDYAGRLIESVGLKGTSFGGARISDLHANFFINESNATANDFLTLMANVRAKVRAAYDIDLCPEVKFVGFDGWARLHALEADL